MCICALAGLPDYDIAKLQPAQNSAARLITLTKKRDHITPILVELHWFPVCQHIPFKVLVIRYIAINGLAPSYTSDLINIHMPSRSLCSSTKLQLSVPHYKTTFYGSRAFSRFAPVKFNKLPQTLPWPPHSRLSNHV